MKNIRTSCHIRTHRGLKSFRYCINATGVAQILPDVGRIYLEECRRLNRVLLAGFACTPRKSCLGA